MDLLGAEVPPAVSDPLPGHVLLRLLAECAHRADHSVSIVPADLRAGSRRYATVSGLTTTQSHHWWPFLPSTGTQVRQLARIHFPPLGRSVSLQDPPVKGPQHRDNARTFKPTPDARSPQVCETILNRLPVKFFGLEATAHPLQQLLVFRIVRLLHRLEQTSVSENAPAIFQRAPAGAVE